MDVSCGLSILWCKNFYGIPCSAVPKDGDLLGRIIHDYGYYEQGSYSVSAAHSSTCVEYIKVVERARQNIHSYIKADLSNGFWQFGTHPND